MKQTKWLGREIDENGIKPNEKNVEAILRLKSWNNTKEVKSFLGATQSLTKVLPKLSEKTNTLRNMLKKNEPWKWEKDQEEDYMQMEWMLTNKPCLRHSAKDKEILITTDGSKTGLGNNLRQKQDSRDIKPIAFRSRYLNDTEKNYSLGNGKIPIFSLRKQSILVHRPLSTRTIDKTQPQQPKR